jgi:alkylation response protein AidB-like acyl-CoA dehydrogenase
LERAINEVLATYGHRDDRSFLGAVFDAGLGWVHHPQGEGGLGLPAALQVEVNRRLEEAGRRLDWLRNPMGIGMVAPAVVAHGTPDQRRRHLRPIFTAEEIWCQLFSEPGAGSDLATLATRAVRDGGTWVVNGQKVWTSRGHEAAFGLLLARTDPDAPKHRGITAFLLDMSLPGVEPRPLRQLTGDDHFSEVYLTDVVVPDSARLGTEGEGWRVAVTTLMNERVSIGGTVDERGSGSIAVAVEAWRRHSVTDAAHRARLMKLWVDAEVYRLGNLRAAQLRARGTPGPEGSVGKLATALLSQRIGAFAVEALGPAAMLYDYGQTPSPTDPVFAFLQAQCHTIAGGTSEILRNILGERILGLPAEPRVDVDRPWRDIPR